MPCRCCPCCCDHDPPWVSPQDLARAAVDPEEFERQARALARKLADKIDADILAMFKAEAEEGAT